MDNKPTWALVAGCAFGAATLLFLMGLALLNIVGQYAIPCGNSFLLTLIFGLCLGLASAFLGGYAKVTGNIQVPWLGNQPLAVAAAGGILFLVIGLIGSHFAIKESCVDRQSSLLRGHVAAIPANIDARPGS